MEAAEIDSAIGARALVLGLPAAGFAPGSSPSLPTAASVDVARPFYHFTLFSSSGGKTVSIAALCIVQSMKYE